MANTSALIFLVLVALTTGATIYDGYVDDAQSCSAIKGQDCVKNEDCECVGKDQRTMICNRFAECNKLDIFDILEKLKGSNTCLEKFKKYCSSEKECYCKTTEMTCENHECVKVKSHVAVL